MSPAEPAQHPRTLLDHDTPTKKDRSQGNGVTFIEQRGNNAEYRVARIACDALEARRRLRVGEFESVAAAGLARPDRRVWLSGDPNRAAAVLLRHFDGVALIDALARATGSAGGDA